jgi:pimeloyl-ACP methyl ester carboxylesterase
VIALAWLALAGGCARLPATGETPLKPADSGELRDYLLAHAADVAQFRPRGPFEVTTRRNHELRLSATQRFDADLYLSAPAGKAPLAILLHGHDNSKDDHAYQAYHLATWGIHGLAVTLPNNGPWVNNGRTLAKIAAFIRRQPETIDPRVDVNRLILVGHSYGGAAVAVALAVGAPAAGGILLDPAGTGRDLPAFLRKVAKPVMVLGADYQISPVRDRGYFYQYIRSGIAEVSIRDAHHQDAEFRLERARRKPGSESAATEALQITFVSALTAAAFSLGETGSFDYAWRSYRGAISSGKFFDALRK